METGSLSKALPVERDYAAHVGNKSLDLKSGGSFVAGGPSLGCAAGSLEKKDAMKIWLEMKENGFLTPAHAQVPTPKKLCTKRSRGMVRSKVGIEKVQQVHRLPHVVAPADGLTKKIDPGIKGSGGILPTPKQCGEKHKIDMDRRKVKVARAQQETRFTKIAASSGLLDKLNPGIVSRIRNSNEVFSAIGALVKSNGLRDGNLQSRQTEYVQKRVGGNHASECSNTLQGSSPLGICPISPSRQMYMTSKHQTEFGHLGIAVTRVKNEVDIDELMSQSSLSNVSDGAISSESNEESTNTDTHPSLPQEGAHLASHWLQLLHQDISRRLEALKCSSTRVQDVIQTDLPLLIAKEYSPEQENEQLCDAGSSVTTAMDIHQAKWTPLFDQMNKALKEEANNLELWLKQVTEMRSQSKEGFSCPKT